MHSKRVTLQEKDVKLARRIRGDFLGDKQNQYREGLRRFQVGAEIAGEADYDDRNRRIPGTGWLPKNNLPKAAEAEQKSGTRTSTASTRGTLIRDLGDSGGIPERNG